MKYKVLEDGTIVTLRAPTVEDQLGSLRFFRNLPVEDRQYLRVDVTRVDVVKRGLEQAESGAVTRILALDGDEIIADGALEYSNDEWSSHIGEIRVIVAREYQKLGIGTHLIELLFHVAEKRNLEKIVMKMASPQTSIRTVCEKLGFRVDATLPNYVSDLDGESQSLIIMTCVLDEWFREMKGYYVENNWDG